MKVVLDTLPVPGYRRMAIRRATWAYAGGRLALRMALDSMRGRRGGSYFGKRLRQFFEDVGGTGIKMGQQLSMRSDLFPPEVCAELASLVDNVPPMTPAEAHTLLEQGLGRPIAEVFSSFVDKPIGSASVACVFRAVLLDGTEVAVKIRRPGIAERFAEDLQAFNQFSETMEWLALVREDTFVHLRRDLKIMFGEELDFRREARYQRLFRKAMKNKRLPWVSTPKVFQEYCTESILVSEFVRGVSAATLLTASDQKDYDTLARLSEQGIEAALFSERLMTLSLWARFEAPFFHADPHPGNLIVMPGSKIIMLDFGACGMTSRRSRLYHREVVRLMVRREPSKMANVMLGDNAPLPHIDVDKFHTVLDDKFQEFIIAVSDRNSPWPERMVSGIWIKMLEVAREFQIRMNLDTVRSIRASLLYDTLVFRLDSSHGMGIMKDYMRDAAWRTQQLLKKRSRELSPTQRWRRSIREQEMMRSTILRLGERIQPTLQAMLAKWEEYNKLSTLAMRRVLDIAFWFCLFGTLHALGRVLEVPAPKLDDVPDGLFVLALLALIRWYRLANFAMDRVDTRNS